MVKPEFTFGGQDDPTLTINSPDGSKSVDISLSNDGILTVDGVAILTAEGTGFEEVTYDGSGKATKITVWTDNGKTQKIKEETMSYTGNNLSQLITDFYDTSGTKIKTVTESMTYSANKVASVDRSIS